MPSDYVATLNDIKNRIRSERVRVVMAANATMVLMYWEIGRIILARQATEGWGAKVIDRLSADLREEFPEMQGLSARNLKYMRKFADAWPDRAIVQRTVAQLPWRSNLALIEKLADPDERLWYARYTAENGWSREILELQIESGLHKRQGRAVNNFALTLPPADSDLTAQVFKDPYRQDRPGPRLAIAVGGRLACLLWLLLPPVGRGADRLSATGDSWPIARGDAALTGTTPARAPEQPVLRWQFNTQARVLASPVIHDGVVYVAASDGNVHALRLADGEPLWTFAAQAGIEAAPLLADGVLYVGDSDGNLHALEAATGQRRWVYAAEGQIMGGANCAPGTPPLILFGSYDYRLHAVIASSGELAWVYETGHYVNGIPAVGDGVALIGGCDEYVHVVRLTDGGLVSMIAAGSYVAASPALRDGQAYVGHYSGEVLGIDLAAGEVRWRFAAEGQPAFFASLAVTTTRVLAGGRHGILHCLARDTGQEIWQFQAQGDIDSSPVVARDRVLFGAGDGRLTMLRFTDGERLWSYLVGSPVTAGVAVVDGWLIAGATDGVIYAFGEAP
ncbi:MAG: DUF1016 N-terminal domain-containing protein [Candidatus Marinimicrobia bacterium]|nr:DUF1016 N-terminal domain-containing protein [Candidatus Neomarinimicrobiota bacterium]